MGCVISGPVIEASLRATTNAWEYVLWTPWFQVPGGEAVNATVVVKNATTYFLATASVQYAKVRPKNPGEPDTLVTSPSGTTALISADISTDTADQAWARVGIAVKDSQGGLGQGDVALYLSHTSCGMLLGSGIVQINPSIAGKDIFIPIGSLHSTLSVSKLKMALLVQDIASAGSGDLDFQLGYRTYETDPELSGAWQKPEGAYTTAASNTEYNTGEVSPVAGFTTKSWFQGGIIVRPSTADISATLVVTLFGKQ
jgi:hypothetical protein